MSDKSSIEWTDATWNPIRGTKGRHMTCSHLDRRSASKTQRAATLQSGRLISASARCRRPDK